MEHVFEGFRKSYSVEHLIFEMEDLELIKYINNSSLRSERIFKDRYNPLESLNDIDFI